VETGIDATSQLVTLRASAARHGQRTRDVATVVGTAVETHHHRRCLLECRVTGAEQRQGSSS
jgi:hypothetical protein